MVYKAEARVAEVEEYAEEEAAAEYETKLTEAMAVEKKANAALRAKLQDMAVQLDAEAQATKDLSEQVRVLKQQLMVFAAEAYQAIGTRELIDQELESLKEEIKLEEEIEGEEEEEEEEEDWRRA